MDTNRNRRDRQHYATGSHPTSHVTQESALLLGMYLTHGGDHPGTKTRTDRDRLREAKRQQRQARKKSR